MTFKACSLSINIINIKCFDNHQSLLFVINSTNINPKNIIPFSCGFFLNRLRLKMGRLTQLMFLLGMVVMLWIPLASANIFDMYPKYSEGEDMSLVEHDTERIGRRLQALSKATFFSMQGSVYPDGIYYVTIYFGNPPKPYFMDVDTGSDLTWLQCDAPCQKCAAGPHQWYKPRQLAPPTDPLCQAVQRTSQRRHDSSKQCDYDIKYADGGFSLGILVRDTVIVDFGNSTLARANSIFGCGYDQEGSLAKSPAPTDGVLGLGSGTVSFPSQWSKQGLVKNVIGLCIAGGGKKGGYMFFGEDYIPTSGMAWVPMVGRIHYIVGAAQIIFGNKLLVKDGDEKRLGGFIFDTGSSYTYFTKQAYVPFLAVIRESIGRNLVEDSTDSNLPVCWKGKKPFRSVADVGSYFKPLTLNFKSTSSRSKSTKLEVRPEGYLIISSKGNVCLGILDGTKVITDGNNILGDISLQGHLVIHDNNKNQMGWVRTDCSKRPKSVVRRQALEDPPQFDGEETIPCSQDLGQAVCPSSSYFLPA